jgi:hypothetical protein
MDKRLSLYLQYDIDKVYQNTDEENEVMANVYTLFTQTRSAFTSNEIVGETKLEYMRRAYMGTLGAIDRTTGRESTKKGKQIRKLVFEMIESKIDTSLPAPKMRAEYRDDLMLIGPTEEMLKYEFDRICSEEVNDLDERNTYTEGTSWCKIGWNPFANSYKKNGGLNIEIKTVDQFYPQVGQSDWRKLDYGFEMLTMSTASIYKLYGRVIRSNRALSQSNAPTNEKGGKTGDLTVDMVNVVAFYFLNENGTVGRIQFEEFTRTVISYEPEWLVRKKRTCKRCKTDDAVADICSVCGYKKWEWVTVDEEILENDLYEMENQYAIEDQQDNGEPTPEAVQEKYDDGIDQGMTEEQAMENAKPWKGVLKIKKGETVPVYKIRQLPFIPRKNISKSNTIFGISDADMLLEIQDELNKSLSRTGEKIQKSGGILFHDKKINISDKNEVLKVVQLTDPQLAGGSKYVDINPNVQGDITYAGMAYESGRSTIGINNSWQGKQDPTASSGKAKEIAAMGTAGRLEAPRIMKQAAWAARYEMAFKFMLAFSDADYTYTKLLPGVEVGEQKWNKFMFLVKDDLNKWAYRDQFAWSTDAAATLSNDRQAMWQETNQLFINGMFGNPADPRTLLNFWGVMQMLQHPLAPYAIASIKDANQHIDMQLEQLLIQNPQLQDMIQQIAKEQGLLGEQRGGARPNSGPQGNGATQASNVERTNERNRSQASGPSRAVVEGAKAGGGNT